MSAEILAAILAAVGGLAWLLVGLAVVRRYIKDRMNDK